jgi:hypothetical protein
MQTDSFVVKPRQMGEPGPAPGFSYHEGEQAEEDNYGADSTTGQDDLLASFTRMECAQPKCGMSSEAVARVRYLKGEEGLRHATLRAR